MLGKPAAGIAVTLEVKTGADEWKLLANGITNADGRIGDLLSDQSELKQSTYRLTFQTASYFQARGINCFYPFVQLVFEIKDPKAHYHVPLLLSPYGYSTYRGS